MNRTTPATAQALAREAAAAQALARTSELMNAGRYNLSARGERLAAIIAQHGTGRQAIDAALQAGLF